jgi:hypothetical protein
VSANIETQALSRKLAGATGTVVGVLAADALGFALIARGRTGAGLGVIAAPLAVPVARRVLKKVRS